MLFVIKGVERMPIKNGAKPKPEEIMGTVTTQLCKCCGHHEVGITTQAGEFIPLRPGMRVTIHKEKKR